MKSTQTGLLDRRMIRQLHVLARLSLLLAVPLVGCDRKAGVTGNGQPDSKIIVNGSAGGPVEIKTSAAEFRILSSGYVQAFLMHDGAGSSLDDPGMKSGATSDTLVSAEREIRDFALDLEHAKISGASGRLGGQGKRIEFAGKSSGLPGIEKTLAIEVYDSFPSLALMSTSYRNIGNREIVLDQVTTQQHMLNASLGDPKARPYAMWSFHGSSEAWGKDDVA